MLPMVGPSVSASPLLEVLLVSVCRACATFPRHLV
jgi:hypothetical protein